MRRPRTGWEVSAHQLLEEQARTYADVLRTIDPDDLPDELVYENAGGDNQQLRGIPAIGRGVAGATAGSQPDRSRIFA